MAPSSRNASLAVQSRRSVVLQLKARRRCLDAAFRASPRSVDCARIAVTWVSWEQWRMVSWMVRVKQRGAALTYARAVAPVESRRSVMKQASSWKTSSDAAVDALIKLAIAALAASPRKHSRSSRKALRQSPKLSPPAAAASSRKSDLLPEIF